MTHRVGFAVLLTFAATAVADNKSAALKELQGAWKVTTGELAGRPLGATFANSTKLTIQDDRYIVMVGDAPDKGTLRIDAGKSPRTMDIIGGEGPNKGKTFLAIYEINGDALRICYDLSGTARPTEFKTRPDSRLFLATYQREKK